MRTIGDYEIEKVDEKGGRAEPQKIKYTTRGREARAETRSSSKASCAGGRSGT